MRILSLNALDGELEDQLRAFLLSQLHTTDIFCFQETLGDQIEALLAELFPASEYSTITANKDSMGNGHYDLYTIIRKPLTITSHHVLLDLNDRETGQALASEIALPDGEKLTVINVHGVPFPGHKLDTRGRLRQSETIVTWQQTRTSPVVICGDFNLLPEAESVKIFTSAGYRDLIADYKIPTTRNELAWEQWPDNKQLYADYTFVSPGLKVTEFTVPNLEVSDHLPMIITIGLPSSTPQ